MMVSEIKMTSLDIAEIVGKEHKNVMRDIRNEIDSLGEETGRLIFELTSYKDKSNRDSPCYEFGKDGAMQLALKYDAKTRRAVIKRINELEQLQVPQVQVTIDKSKDLEIKQQATEARYLNAQARLESVRLKKQQFAMEVAETFKDVLSPDMKQLIASNLINQSTGQSLLPAPETEKLFTCEEIGTKVGLFSKSGKPHKQLVAAITSFLTDHGEIEEHELKRVLESKGNWTGDTVKYKESVIEKVVSFLQGLSLDEPIINLRDKNYNFDASRLNLADWA
ncbi:Rha family transcriptional regulator [Ammoniphilus oxalaticus]|uniref:Rha family transcriptional regulator n=1 Tax=Ammoniphilus oxalaticus TaxID=66863 RepID=UPI001FE81500|nr:Rha family transcriptional regulator [Ammoniphilus oxalaticus]